MKGADSMATSGPSSATPAPRARHAIQMSQQNPPLISHVMASSPKKAPMWVLCSRCIIENTYFNIFTAILTIWALIGDDIRMLFTDISFDFAYNCLVWLMIATFALELLLSCLGKEDYVFGFFFWLDVISTVTLFLDLQVVNDMLWGGGDTEDGEAGQLRSSRSARIGAKAGRVVRVLRLVRILKLYKAYYEAKMRKKAAEERKKRGETEEDDWDEEDLEGADDEDVQGGIKDREQSRVGKKLSDMTTRRVIVIILTMLLLLPTLQASPPVSSSAIIGADYIRDALVAYRQGKLPKSAYETALLQYVYYHNWFSGRYEDCEACSSLYYARLFWIGISGENLTAVQGALQSAILTKEAVEAFNTASQQNTNYIYNYGSMPPQALDVLSGQWNQNCDTTKRMYRGISLLKAEDSIISYAVPCPEQLRGTEQMRVSPYSLTLEVAAEWNLVFYFDLRLETRERGVFGIVTTFFVLVLLISGSVMFSVDANRLVVNPVEKMIKRVEAIRENPLVAMKMADEEFRAEEVAKAKERRAADFFKCSFCSKKNNEPMETVILEKTIIKLGSLLALGFGEAGANIVGQNMKGSDSAGVNAMIPGLRVDCVVGVARVGEFSTATEVLQARIMTFVNQIAEIVHGVVNEYNGAPNKNHGDAFLIIWRLEKERTLEKTQRVAEMSVVAFAQILGSLHRSPVLASYREHPGLQMRLGTNCRVHLTFGLHLGWAIEGAVGSEYKIDASYLSPNVSIATSVELATHIYGVTLLAAQSVVDHVGARLLLRCRLIDRVIITGSARPMGLYCIDLDHRSVDVSDELPLGINWSTRNRFKARQFIEAAKSSKFTEAFDPAGIFDDDPTLVCMRRRYTIEFFQLFNMGFQNYSQGEWQVARRMLSCTRAILGIEDGPSNALLRYMEAHGYDAPKGWRGVREVDTR
eukprot:TRINITY_DN40749_c0_g1_i1.p1 TRINITY_DN40749_c0_g1~~TRINITY_DN40749_c0_g1_i1.p1  ORF type:complete len:925 (-),score=106.14 TRINITY_DN40749_c0_g1_i1:119-2893(-)